MGSPAATSCCLAPALSPLLLAQILSIKGPSPSVLWPRLLTGALLQIGYVTPAIAALGPQRKGWLNQGPLESPGEHFKDTDACLPFHT